MSNKDKDFYLEGASQHDPVSFGTSQQASQNACKLGPDTIKHFLSECKLTVDVWKLVGLGDIIKKACVVIREGEVILQNLLCKVEQGIHVLALPKLREIVATTTWYLWYERRKLTHGEGEPTQGADQINVEVRSLAANFIISCSPKEKRRVAAWMKPKHGYMKLNVDPGYDVDTLERTVGAVLQDHIGKFIVSANEKIDICFDSFTAKVTAVRFGMNLARTVGVTKIEINSDSVEVIEALKDGYSSSVASAYLMIVFYVLGFQPCM